LANAQAKSCTLIAEGAEDALTMYAIRDAPLAGTAKPQPLESTAGKRRPFRDREYSKAILNL
jgi:hypothetical protein